MADNVTLNAGSGGAALATDDILSVHYQRVKVTYGVDGSATDVSDSNPLPVDDAGGSLTVDNAALSVTGGGVEASALRVTLANDSTGVLSVDDNGSTLSIDDGAGSITVDNGGTFAVQAAQSGSWSATVSNQHEADFDTGAGIDTTAAFGIAVPASGGAAIVPGDATAGLKVDLGADNDVTVTGTVTADLGANNDVTVTGGNAHDGTTLGNPVLGGARATNSIEGVTQVANADLTHLQADLNGVLLTRPHTTLEEIITERVSDTAGTSAAFTNFAAGGAGIHNYITTISVMNTSATDGYVDFRDGTAGAIVFTAPAPATGGSVINLPVPIKFAANTAVAYDVSGALSTVYISVVGFQAQG